MSDTTSSPTTTTTTNTTTTTTDVKNEEQLLSNIKELNVEETAKEDEPIPGLLKSDQLNDFDAQLEVLQSDPNSPLYSVKSFEELGLKPEVLKGVYAMNYNKPSKIQETALPVILNTKDNLVAQSQSGTGKTAAFTLGMLNIVDPSINQPQAICICPSRELALQIHGVVCKLGRFTKIQPLLFIPDIQIPQTITNQVIIGTPGRMYDGLANRKINSRYIKLLVLDEADVMVDQRGHNKQTTDIKRLLPKNIKVLLFSATFSKGVENMITRFVPDPKVQIMVKRQDLSVDKIQQFYVDCGSQPNKQLILSDLYGYISVGQSIVFVHTIEMAKNLAEKMKQEGHSISLLYGRGMETEQRFKEIQDFKDGKTKVLISTNVIARGIDILQVSLVINYDLPMDENGQPDPVTYLHRVGRVGRFGRSGVAISFVHDTMSKNQLQSISKHLEREVQELKSTELDKLDGILRNLRDLTPKIQ
eukprot:gene11382-13938_t